MSQVKLMKDEWGDGPHEADYYLPDSWDVTVYHIAGYQRPVMTQAQIKDALNHPLGSPCISELARGKKKVCILFDDVTRGTPVYQVIPHVLAELKEAGIQDKAIEFICALGAHQAWDRSLLAKKIGEDVMAKYPVYNHFPFMNCTSLGKTSFGTKVEISSEVMSCDLKISIGGISPHPQYGFSGGAKMIMPGVSSYDSMYEHHGVTHQAWFEAGRGAGGRMGSYDGNPMPADALEFARMAELDFSISCLLSEKSEIVGIFAGEVEASDKEGVEAAKKHYVVSPARDNDISISNAVCKAAEAYIASLSAWFTIKHDNGTAVTLANSHAGQVAHYLQGSWGKSFGGRNLRTQPVPPWVAHHVFYSEFPEARNWDRWAEKDHCRILLPSNWAEVIAKLIEWHGLKAKVAVFPDGTNQYLQQPERKDTPTRSEERLKV